MSLAHNCDRCGNQIPFGRPFLSITTKLGVIPADQSETIGVEGECFDESDICETCCVDDPHLKPLFDELVEDNERLRFFISETPETPP